MCPGAGLGGAGGGRRGAVRPLSSSGTCLSSSLSPETDRYHFSPLERLHSSLGSGVSPVRIRICKIGDKITLKGLIKEMKETEFSVSCLCPRS